MRYRRLDINDDYSFGHGSQDFLVNTPATVAQAVLTTMRLFQGEWFLDTSAGVPYLTKVTGYGTRPLYDSVIKSAILGVENVKSILEYSSNLDPRTRKLTVEVTIDTNFGPIVIQPVTVTPPAGGGYGVGGLGEAGYGE